MPRIDVAIPNYNYGRFLGECVRSVQAQDFADFRVVVIDNASTDGSAALVRRLTAEDPRIELVEHARNLGPHASYNCAIDLARADYLMILCSDDSLEPGALRRAVETLDRNPRAVAALGAGPPAARRTRGQPHPPTATEDRVIAGGAFVARLCDGLAMETPAHDLVVRTSAQKEAGPYRPSLRHMDDVEMLLRLAMKGDVAELWGPMIVKRDHDSNRLRALWDDWLADLRERQAAFESFFAGDGAALPASARLRRLVRCRLAATAYWSALSHVLRRKSGTVSLLRYACELDASLLLFPPLAHLLRRPDFLQRTRRLVLESVGQRLPPQREDPVR